MSDRQFGTVVIGGSQSGLAVGHHLRKWDLSFVILDENDRIGDAWRKRWDSLRLFTPGRYDGLPGMPFPGSPSSYPTKDETADYLEAYAREFDLPVRTGVKVDRLSKAGDRFEVSWGERTLLAENVVVATGAFNNPRVPAFARELDERIVQLHSKEYRNRSQIQKGGVLVVGAGNSGAEIAIELAPHHKIWLAGPDTGQEPTRAGSRLDRLVTPILWLVATRLTVKMTLGRKLRDQFLDPPRGIPLGACATKGLCPRRHRKSAANDGRGERMSRSRGWQSPRGVERHLVHRLRTLLRLDRSLAADPQWPSHSRSGHRRVLSGSLLRRAPLPLLAELGAGGRCGAGCRAHRQAHRFHATGRTRGHRGQSENRQESTSVAGSPGCSSQSFSSRRNHQMPTLNQRPT
jgi:hypothetical protein